MTGAARVTPSPTFPTTSVLAATVLRDTRGRHHGAAPGFTGVPTPLLPGSGRPGLRPGLVSWRSVTLPATGWRVRGGGDGAGEGGVRAPVKPGAEGLLDYLAGTFPVGVPVAVVQELLGGGEWVVLPRGRWGYRRALARGRVTIYHDGQPDMGAHFVASGKGCRELEATGVIDGPEGWRTFLARLLRAEVSFTRTDAAIDDREGLIPVERLEEIAKEGSYVSRLRKWRSLTEGESPGRRSSADAPGGARITGRGVRWGVPGSDTQIKIYDHALLAGEEAPCARVELQLRNERARSFVRRYVETGTLALAGLLRHYIEFKLPGSSPRRWRWETAPWWLALLQHAAKVQLAVQPVVRTIDTAARWVKKQVAPSLALITHALGLEAVLGLIADGSQRLSPWQRSLLAAHGPPGARDAPR